MSDEIEFWRERMNEDLDEWLEEEPGEPRPDRIGVVLGGIVMITLSITLLLFGFWFVHRDEVCEDRSFGFDPKSSAAQGPFKGARTLPPFRGTREEFDRKFPKLPPPASEPIILPPGVTINQLNTIKSERPLIIQRGKPE